MKRRLVKKWLKRTSNKRLGRKMVKREFDHVAYITARSHGQSYKAELERLNAKIYGMSVTPKINFRKQTCLGNQ